MGYEELMALCQKVVDENEVITKIRGSENYLSIYFEKDGYKTDLVCSAKDLENNLDEIIKSFEYEARVKLYQRSLRENKDSTVLELIQDAMSNNFTIGYIYDFASALEFVRVNDKSVTILDALDNKKYIDFRTINNFDKEGLIIY